MHTKTIRRLCALLALCLMCVPLSASGRRLPASMVFPSEQADAALPTPLTATLQGKTVTMAYTAITAIPWPTDVRPTWFHNGFMPVYGYVDPETGETAAGGAYMNTAGRIICEPIYDELYDFDDTGFAIAEKSTDGSGLSLYEYEWARRYGQSFYPRSGQGAEYVYINRNGEAFACADTAAELSLTKTEPPPLYGYTAGYLLERVKGRYRVLDSTGAVVATLPKTVTTAERAAGGAIIATAVDPETGREKASLYSVAGRRLTKQPLQRIGGFEAGLAPFLQDGRLGLLAETGKIIIPATWPVEVEPEDHFLLFEGLMAVNTGGYISIIRVEQK